MVEMSTVEKQIATRSEKFSGEALTNLHSYITPAYMSECFERLNKRGAIGVDGQTWADYDAEREDNIERLYNAFKSGNYRAPHVRRTYIPKGGGKKRPLGLPTVEDKLLQSAVASVLTPLYEQEFYDFSYGYRRGKSPHDAIDKLFKEVSFGKKHYVIDADIQ